MEIIRVIFIIVIMIAYAALLLETKFGDWKA